MPRLIVLYPTPSDAQEFERQFREEHQPLVRAQLSTARRVTAGTVAPVGGEAAPYYWMAELHFGSMDELQHAVSSDGGLRAGAHARQISTGGAPMMFVVDDESSGPPDQPAA